MSVWDVGTEVTHKEEGFFLMINDQVKMKIVKHKNKEDNNNKKDLHNTVVWLSRLREQNF